MIRIPLNVEGIGIDVGEDRLKLLYYSKGDEKEIKIAESIDGINFEKSKSTFKFDIPNLNLIKISSYKKDKLISYEVKTSNGIETFLGDKRMPPDTTCGIAVPGYLLDGKEVFYFGGEKIIFATFKTASSLLTREIKINSKEKIYVDFTIKTSQGIFLIYHTFENGLKIKGVCFDLKDPKKIIWETKSSLWPEPELWKNKNIKCIGCAYFKGRLISYWQVADLGIFLINYPLFEEKPAHENHHYKLEKHLENPVLSPKSENAWESEATFNPAAFYEDGKVYLVYRAVGHDYISVLGMAESQDGIHFDKRHPEPIYTGHEDFESKSPYATKESIKRYWSGGGYGGCEDPRITRYKDRLYMIYVAFNGWDMPRLAMTSILYKDFLDKNFLWEKPVLISPPGTIDKSGCLLPEKVNGKFVIFHRVYPNILIDFVDDLNFDGTFWLKGEYKIEPRSDMWDSRKIGAGAPPIKTKDGWLLIYQAVTDKDDSKYKVGAMLLDLEDPTKVLHRSAHPIIEPTEHYENNLAKFGIVYPCGAVVVDGKLLVYYGGSDSVSCVASADLEEFLNELKTNNGGKLETVKFI